MQTKKKNILRFSRILESAIQCIDEMEDRSDYLVSIRNKCIDYLELFSYFEKYRVIYIDKLRELVSFNIDDESIISLIRKYDNKNNRMYLSRSERRSFYKELFALFNDDVDEIINNNLDDLQSRFARNKNGYPQTFLSYSYADKGLTLILFFYFYINHGYLYMDWLHSPAYPNGVVIKESLSNALHQSRQLLFLYTPNSEVRNSTKRSLKEWCSWEFGSFYLMNDEAKFYIRLPNNLHAYEIPDILDTFQEMYEVVDGKMYGGYRSLFSFYAPTEKELSEIAIDLLSSYVDKKYESFLTEYQMPNTHFRFDAYDPKTNTAIEFKAILDDIRNKNETKYFFKNSEIVIDKDGIVPKIKRMLMMANEQLSYRDVNFELALLLPTRNLSTLSKDIEKGLVEQLLFSNSGRLKKVYFFYVDGIRQISFDKDIKYKTYRYTEKDI